MFHVHMIFYFTIQKALVDGMFDFAQRFTQFNLTDTEVGLVTCLILTNSGKSSD